MRRLPVVLVAGLAVFAACSGAPRETAASASPAERAASAPRPSVLLTGLREDVARFAGLDNVARGDTLLRILRERGFEPAVQLFANTAQQREPRAQGRNLVVTVGSGPRDIVIGAHYDAVRLADGRVTGGAVDNGAGAVIMTRVAETLRGQALRHRVRVVLFDLEEVGLLGSQAYIAAEGAERVAAMVNVDIAAHGDAIVYGPASHNGNTQVYREFRQVCAVHGPCIEFPAFPRSDDRSFQAAGVPNISIGIAPAVDAHQLWLLLNAGPNAGLREGWVPALMGIIHTPADTLAHVDPAAMQRLHDAVVALVLRLDAAL
jgi:Zn-dependent M28 family amino/carboxypeptidase